MTLKLPDRHQGKHDPYAIHSPYYTKFVSNSERPLQLALNFLFTNVWLCLSLMLYMLFGNFHIILQSFAIRVGLHIGIQFFMTFKVSFREHRLTA